ncbi:MULTISPECIES: thiamine diphosphokinase [unclassified Paracoccus (in: a-proteobacteria)]|uniref:thiamine diphosphokinase n=1 Tax=unclassified Paracoccus (in: a-proteobacteria) TaxID=2688777 RepID=UPI001600ACFD|nr:MULTISPECIES: thiamine diphosphokinase [unclassified Paracoccus (in: a-proteobacteria)]MBB1492406.1 thiamine diphosphokinase [Paracoccus sp. MC1854]MBB1496765.1 thiamine diphosphokinase [Paracoccus sp. MC1862]QQO45401.1 thiamine diphosphokinase [Paracoccus sp. MC1862]
MTPVLTSAAGVTLIGGGAVTAADLAEALALAPTVAAADSGADRALADGIMPQAVIGDLDSLSTAGRAAIPPDRLHHVPEQETTDFEKCLTRIAAPFVVAVGFTGSRADHLLACLTTLVRVPRPCLLLGGEDAIFAAPARLALDLPPGTRLSLYPLGPVTGTSRGLRWPIDGLTLDPARRTGTSNETTGPVELALDGPCLVILPRAQAAAAIQAITSA